MALLLPPLPTGATSPLAHVFTLGAGANLTLDNVYLFMDSCSDLLAFTRGLCTPKSWSYNDQVLLNTENQEVVYTTGSLQVSASDASAAAPQALLTGQSVIGCPAAAAGLACSALNVGDAVNLWNNARESAAAGESQVVMVSISANIVFEPDVLTQIRVPAGRRLALYGRPDVPTIIDFAGWEAAISVVPGGSVEFYDLTLVGLPYPLGGINHTSFLVGAFLHSVYINGTSTAPAAGTVSGPIVSVGRCTLVLPDTEVAWWRAVMEGSDDLAAPADWLAQPDQPDPSSSPSAVRVLRLANAGSGPSRFIIHSVLLPYSQYGGPLAQERVSQTTAWPLYEAAAAAAPKAGGSGTTSAPQVQLSDWAFAGSRGPPSLALASCGDPRAAAPGHTLLLAVAPAFRVSEVVPAYRNVLKLRGKNVISVPSQAIAVAEDPAASNAEGPRLHVMLPGVTCTLSSVPYSQTQRRTYYDLQGLRLDTVIPSTSTLNLQDMVLYNLSPGVMNFYTPPSPPPAPPGLPPPPVSAPPGATGRRSRGMLLENGAPSPAIPWQQARPPRPPSPSPPPSPARSPRLPPRSPPLPTPPLAPIPPLPPPRPPNPPPSPPPPTPPPLPPSPPPSPPSPPSPPLPPSPPPPPPPPELILTLMELSLPLWFFDTDRSIPGASSLQLRNVTLVVPQQEIDLLIRFLDRAGTLPKAGAAGSRRLLRLGAASAGEENGFGVKPGSGASRQLQQAGGAIPLETLLTCPYAQLISFSQDSKVASYTPDTIVYTSVRHLGWSGTNVTITSRQPPDAPSPLMPGLQAPLSAALDASCPPPVPPTAPPQPKPPRAPGLDATAPSDDSSANLALIIPLAVILPIVLLLVVLAFFLYRARDKRRAAREREREALKEEGILGLGDKLYVKSVAHTSASSTSSPQHTSGVSVTATKTGGGGGGGGNAFSPQARSGISPYIAAAYLSSSPFGTRRTASMTPAAAHDRRATKSAIDLSGVEAQGLRPLLQAHVSTPPPDISTRPTKETLLSTAGLRRLSNAFFGTGETPSASPGSRRFASTSAGPNSRARQARGASHSVYSTRRRPSDRDGSPGREQEFSPPRMLPKRLSMLFASSPGPLATDTGRRHTSTTAATLPRRSRSRSPSPSHYVPPSLNGAGGAATSVCTTPKSRAHTGSQVMDTRGASLKFATGRTWPQIEADPVTTPTASARQIGSGIYPQVSAADAAEVALVCRSPSLSPEHSITYAEEVNLPADMPPSAVAAAAAKAAAAAAASHPSLRSAAAARAKAAAKPRAALPASPPVALPSGSATGSTPAAPAPAVAVAPPVFSGTGAEPPVTGTPLRQPSHERTLSGMTAVSPAAAPVELAAGGLILPTGTVALQLQDD